VGVLTHITDIRPLKVNADYPVEAQRVFQYYHNSYSILNYPIENLARYKENVVMKVNRIQAL